jgi:hypothetical protein
VREDVDIREHQLYINRPPMAEAAGKNFIALREWVSQFFELETNYAQASRGTKDS